MRILSRHLVGRFLVFFAVILVVLTLAVLVGDMLLDFGGMLEQSERLGVGVALVRFALRTPARYLPLLVPVAAFAAAFLATGLAARSHEIVAMKAGGISPLRATLPVLGCAVVLAVASLAVNETVLVSFARLADRVDRGSPQEIALRRGALWYRSENRVISIDESDPATRTLRGVTVYERDERGRLQRSLQAKRATVEKGAGWLLQDVVVRTFDPSDPTAAPRFERLAELRIASATQSARVLFDARASTLSLADLAGSGAGERGRRFHAILHERLSDPALVVVLALLALPLGLKVEQARTLAAPALQGALLLVALFTARSLGSTLASEGVTPPALTAWTIVAAFALFGAIRLRAVPR